MKRLLVLRHAKSSWDDPTAADHERELAPRGRRAAARVEAHLRSSGARVDLVLCSSARRTRQTLELIEPALGEAEVIIEPALYGASTADLLDRLRRIPEEVAAAMLIGHNPAMQDLALEIGTGDLSGVRGKFPTAALATFELDGPWSDLREGGARLVAFVTPRELE
jgi:phosphohistidine phosphatase